MRFSTLLAAFATLALTAAQDPSPTQDATPTPPADAPPLPPADNVDAPIEDTSSADFLARGGSPPPPTPQYLPLGAKCADDIMLKCQPNASCVPSKSPGPNHAGTCRLVYRNFGEQCGGAVAYPFACRRGLYCQRNKGQPGAQGVCVYPPPPPPPPPKPTSTIIVVPITTVTTVIITQTQQTITETAGGSTTVVVVPASTITNVIPTIIGSTTSGIPTSTSTSTSTPNAQSDGSSDIGLAKAGMITAVTTGTMLLIALTVLAN